MVEEEEILLVLKKEIVDKQNFIVVRDRFESKPKYELIRVQLKPKSS